MLWPKKKLYQEFDNEKKFLRLENSSPPPPLITFLKVRPLTPDNYKTHNLRDPVIIQERIGSDAKNTPRGRVRRAWGSYATLTLHQTDFEREKKDLKKKTKKTRLFCSLLQARSLGTVKRYFFELLPVGIWEWGMFIQPLNFVLVL